MKATLSQSGLFFLVIFTTLMLVGCGQSGPLYLPKQQQPKSTNQTPKASDAETQQKKDALNKQQEG
ncbi:LPS translocon maturation chaperone LptM [Pseudoalteromonas byunsanensis]|uniref:Lipoprotein n=1 Tax=Pseudoalteromonas byunsanensis TaxID=327939 RepID=A0A1S1NHB2_9GAMM|nr:lipoprotein [Pseudoalteromonas byunsanensis]OHU97973.1 hypothetical protein BIW53_00145 [Pseudoalteromonas byunsanensis]